MRAPRKVPADRLPLLTKIAVMYHEQGIRQPEIAKRLHISQSRVSRFLKEAVSLGIVRTVVIPPPGVNTGLESTLVEKYGLLDAVVIDPFADDESVLLRALGAAAAAYLDTTLVNDELVGISSWSSTLLATVEAMSARPSGTARKVVQVLGGMGRPGAEVMATRLAERLSQVLGAQAVYLQAPAVVDSSAARETLLGDTKLSQVISDWSELSLLLVGIGALEPSPLLQDSGNTLSEHELDQLHSLGAVGDVCLRFFDSDGALVRSDLDDRVVGIGIEQLQAVPRKVGIAGGARKVNAIRAATAGRWIDVLITDTDTAQALLDG
jgi:DNA-binding transcriptional regulator LsrR (DeoR family)